MCAYVFVSVCVGMCWMFSWEQQGRPGRGGRTESDDATAEKSEIVCVQCVETQIKYGGDSRVLTWGGGAVPSFLRRGNILNSFDQIAGMKSQTSEPTFFPAQYVSKSLTRRILVVDMKC